MENVFLPWTNFKTMAISKNLSIQYTETQVRYYVFAIDDPIKYECELWKDTSAVEGIDVTQNNTDLAEFEASFKAEANKPVTPKTSDRLPKFLSAVSVDDVSLYVTGSVALINGSNDVIDSDFDGEIQLQGMMVAVQGANWGDTVDVEVGYIDAQQNWVPLKKFGESVPMKDTADWQEYHYKNNAVSKIPDSLKIRFKYHQANVLTTKKVVLHYIAHK